MIDDKNPILKALDRAITALAGSSGPENSAKNIPSKGESKPRPARGEAAPADAKLPPRPTAEQLAPVPWPSPETGRAIDAVLYTEGYARPAKALAQLKELDPAYIRLQNAVIECTKSQRSKHAAHVADIARRTREGDLTVHTEDTWSAEDFESDARERLKAFKAELGNVAQASWEIAQPALLEKAEFVSKLADRLELEELERFKKFAVPYRPPTYILLIRKYAVSLSDGQRRTAGLPSAMLESL